MKSFLVYIISLLKMPVIEWIFLIINTFIFHKGGVLKLKLLKTNKIIYNNTVKILKYIYIKALSNLSVYSLRIYIPVFIWRRINGCL